MKKIIMTFSFILIFLGMMTGFTQELPKGKVVLSEIIQEALRVNPRIHVAEKEWKAALEKIPQVKALPDPMLRYSRFGQSIETRLGPQRNKISLSQKFPFFGKLALKGEVARSYSSLLEEEYSAVKADIVLKVKRIFFSLYWFDKALTIAQEEKEVLQRLTRIAQKKYETGTANQQDVLKAQLEISKILDKILTLKQGRKALASQLNSLLNKPQDARVGEVEEFQVPEFLAKLSELSKWAIENRPELKKARRLIEKNEKSLKLTKKNYFPDFQLMLDYIDIGGGTTTNPNDGQNAWMGSIGVSIPLWRNKLRAAEAEEAIKLEASRDRYRDMENDTLSRVNELFFEVKTTEEQINLYKYSLLPQAEQSFKASETAYLTGKVDFLNLLESERTILRIKTGYYKAISDFGKSLAHLDRVVGRESLMKFEKPNRQNKIEIATLRSQ
ncbi:MAG: TolC family protein [Candidatus Aminicenantes bacterium]|nr:MAG: TolC family protein [Candidatus Aminicenantes bacterium]